ncbi:hypothetical protein PPTG_14878 [Phytophthora nicotianae INRA-310]|uniref:Argonaute linker 1 domain-containing protein n=1 Tax=Phytophthora nicotianae (strain INRA-310) TaxID=761204 RepID=W2PVW4_PHYN3|nr:hypothetical protein PPTG_14878 [Phytophthora nicotianae INRA-310]ETN04165.1 hypothetical protein PPTG_14878 [Phytophthora nicotianae INRA-310]
MTFDVKIQHVESIEIVNLLQHYSDPEVNVMPVMQAIDVVTRHQASQSMSRVGRALYTMINTHTLQGGRELCLVYHQAVRKATETLVLNLNETSAVFYAPGPLMQMALAALRISNPRSIRNLTDKQLKSLSHTLPKVEATTTHRNDRSCSRTSATKFLKFQLNDVLFYS